MFQTVFADMDTFSIVICTLSCTSFKEILCERIVHCSPEQLSFPCQCYGNGAVAVIFCKVCRAVDGIYDKHISSRCICNVLFFTEKGGVVHDLRKRIDQKLLCRFVVFRHQVRIICLFFHRNIVGCQETASCFEDD